LGRGTFVLEKFVEFAESPEYDLNRIVLIPRQKNNNTYTINNGWDTVLKLPNNKLFVDIGGGKTNAFYNNDNVEGLINSVQAEMKGSTQAPGLTGVIRAELEKAELENVKCDNIETSNILIGEMMYEPYFPPGQLTVFKLISPMSHLFTEGGRRRRTRRRRRTKRRSRRGRRTKRRSRKH